MRSLEIVRRARDAGYEGGKSAFYSLIASVRPRRSRPLGEHDKVPGEIARHGFGQVDLKFRDGSERSMTFFVSRLEYSRFTIASIVPDQGLETCVRTLVAHCRSFGGIPLLAAFDRARPIGVGSDKDGRVLNGIRRLPMRRCRWAWGSRCARGAAPIAARGPTSATG